MVALGFLGALLMGIVLGLIGGGGSILTVPVFVYILNVNPVLATAYSLFVVGVASLVGAIKNSRNNLVDFKTGLVFAIPAFIGVFFARVYLINIIPDQILLFSFSVSKDMAIMIFFAMIMIAASYFMIRGNNVDFHESSTNYNPIILVFEGLIVGVLTGVVGAGGGFLIIPALVLFARLPMKKAVATSLMIIAVKSLFGFIGDLNNVNLIFDWPLLITFSLVSILGIFLGIYFNNFIDGGKLKKGFGWFVLIMAICILIKEFI